MQVHAGSAKAGIDAVTRHLANEWGPYGIRVVAIAPGPIADTDGMQRMVPEPVREKLVGGIPLRRLGTTSEIGQVAAFLVSDAAGWITGTTVIVDGGQRLGCVGPLGSLEGH